MELARTDCGEKDRIDRDGLEGQGGIDRGTLMERMARELPLISGEMGTSPVGIAYRTGLDKGRMKLLVSGQRKMKWSEFMSILFVPWDDDIGLKIVEEKGLFPDTLKKAMKVKS